MHLSVGVHMKAGELIFTVSDIISCQILKFVTWSRRITFNSPMSSGTIRLNGVDVVRIRREGDSGVERGKSAWRGRRENGVERKGDQCLWVRYGKVMENVRQYESGQ